MRLSKRIYALVDAVNRGDSVADIGTDHGYVPMLLMKRGISPRVIMSDISEGSLAKAKETFNLCGMTDLVTDGDFRVGDGLQTIASSEVDEIIIAGLGGHTIKGILEADENKSKSFSRLILQPRKHSGVLRHYLYTHGWDITSDSLAKEGKFACEIITAVPASEECRTRPYPEDDIRWKYPESLVNADPDAALNRIRWKASSIREQIENLSSGSDDHSDLIKRLIEDAAYLNGLEKSILQLIEKE